MKYIELDVSEPVLQAVKKMGFTDLTEIQEKAIPVILDGYEVVAKAPTGTGKTCAFGIPIMEMVDERLDHVQALVLAPTRELTLQICDDLRSLAHFIPELKIVAVYGGQPIKKQLDALKKKPQIVVATPGRLMDHMRHGSLKINQVHIAVLDEADEMLNMGFYKDVRWILDRIPKNSQLCMFSATLSRSVMDISWLYQRDEVEITIDPVEESKPMITQYRIESTGRQKLEDLVKIIRQYGYQKAMIFCNTKYQTEALSRQLNERGFHSTCLHGDLAQQVRNRIMADFRNGKADLLVATDVAARGIDISDVDVVFSYEIPTENGFYVHRIGRTGRAKREGVSYLFVSPDDQKKLREIMKYTNSEILPVTVSEDGTLVPAAPPTE